MHSHHVARASRAASLALIALAVFLTGCSSLPDFSKLEQRLKLREAGPVQIIGSDSLLMGDFRTRIENQVLKDSNATQRHLQIMQAASESPLVLGNTAAILIDGPKAYDAIFKAIESDRKSVV